AVQSSAQVSDTLARVDTAAVYREINVPFEIRVSCQDQKYELAWSLEHLDSADLPFRLRLKGYRYEEADTHRIQIKNQVLDSAVLYETASVWIATPGYYYLEGKDSSRKIHYSSDAVHLDLCARYQLPDRFVYGSVKLFTPT